jgi:hypothetical protein
LSLNSVEISIFYQNQLLLDATCEERGARFA